MQGKRYTNAVFMWKHFLQGDEALTVGQYCMLPFASLSSYFMLVIDLYGSLLYLL